MQRSHFDWAIQQVTSKQTATDSLAERDDPSGNVGLTVRVARSSSFAEPRQTTEFEPYALAFLPHRHQSGRRFQRIGQIQGIY
jgi:hypothetical protein